MQTIKHASLYSEFFFQKLGQWYRQKYKCAEVVKANTHSSANPLTAVFAMNIEKAPWRLTPVHMYYKLHYHTHIKDKFLWHCVVVKKAYDDASQEDQDSGAIKKPVPLQYRNEIEKEFWLLESSKFRDKVAQQVEDTHLEQLQAWEEARQVPKTARQFHQ